VRGREILEVKAIMGVIVPHVVMNWDYVVVIVLCAMCSTSYAN
jgi:hypothetical protein